MRPDFDKVLVERPRLGGHWARKRGRQFNPKYVGGLPSKEGIKRPYGYNTKSLNENLSPLKRYLNSQVGRSWDKVYSEIRQMIGKNPNAVKGHILQHLYGWDGIYIHVNIVDNKVFRKNSRFQYGETELNNNQLYVDSYGIIRRYRRKSGKKQTYRQQQEETWMKTARHLPNGTQARKINGIWYVVSLTSVKKDQIFTQTYKTVWGTSYSVETVVVNDILGTRGSTKDFISKYGSLVYAISKRTMTSKELKIYDLHND